MKILVVEDELASMKLISHLMGKHGVCDTASDGIEAVKLFEAALDDPKNVMNALYQGGASEYLVKPITVEDVEGAMKKVKLLQK